MKINRFLLLTLLLFNYSSLLSQNYPRFFAGIESFRSTKLNNNSFYSLQIGSEITHFKLIAPEINFEYTFGSVEKSEQFNPNINAPDNFLNRSFKSNILSFTPKIFFGDNEWKFLLLPKYSLAKITARGFYYETNDSGLSYDLEKKEIIEENISYFSLGIGIEGAIFNSDKLTMVFSIHYTGIEAGKTLEKLDFSEFDYGKTTDNIKTLGLGVKLYFNPFEKTTMSSVK